MISAGSVELTQKWIDVLHSEEEDFIIPESDVDVLCPYDCVGTSNYDVSGYSAESCSDLEALSIGTTIINRNKKVATLEWNYWVLDGSFEVLDDNETVKGFVSTNISGAECEFSSSPFVFFDTDGSTFPLRKNQTLKFNPPNSEVPASITIQSTSPGGLLNSIDFNIEEMLENDDVADQEYINLYSNSIDTTNSNTRAIIIFTKTIMPYRRARLTEYNNGYKFFKNKHDLQSFVHTRSAQLNMSELPQNDLEISFSDLEGVFDDERTNVPFRINFNKSHRFYVHYGYNFNDIGWNYVLADTLIFDIKEINRDDVATTLKMNGVLHSYNQYYRTSLLDKRGQNGSHSQIPPYNWNTFQGFITAIKNVIPRYAGSLITINIDSNRPDYIDYSADYWQHYLWATTVVSSDDNISKTPAKELLQQISALLRCVIVVQPNGDLFFKNIATFNTTPVDNILSDFIMAYPTITQENGYGKIYVETPPVSPEQNDDEQVTVTVGDEITYRYYNTRYGFLIDSSLSEEESLKQNVLPLDEITSSNAWHSWASGTPAYTLLRSYAIWFNAIHKRKVCELGDCFFNPLLQVADTLSVSYGDDYKSYKGVIDKIEVNYDGSFKGVITMRLI